jgi:hypothetical protein
VKPMTYSMQFRGQASERDGGVMDAVSTAPSCAHLTTIGADGLDGRFLPAPGDEARCESHMSFVDDLTFEERGTIRFGRGNLLRFQTISPGRIERSPDPNLVHGTAIWEVDGGEGQFEGARGRITSNFFLSDTGELTDNQFGVLFLHRNGKES